MAVEYEEEEEHSSTGLMILLAGVALLLGAGALAWIFFLQSRVDRLETKLDQAQEQIGQESAEQADLRRQLRAATDAFGEKVGITQRQIESRSEQILRQQDAATSRLAARMSQDAAATRQQVSSVSNAVSNVQTDVGGVKQDVASTRQELTATEQQLHAAIGDMGVQSGLIAKNSEELDYLRHIGDRRYFEFTLRKGQAPQAVSTVKLQLRKADAKHSRYTLRIVSDDKRLEKKNRDLDEPLQFYSGKPPMLFEVVVNQIGKNDVSGYLSAPKSAPVPAVP